MILTYVRLAHYDAATFACFLPRLLDLAAETNATTASMVAEATTRVWEAYFRLVEPYDLAFEIGRLLYALGDYSGAIKYFERSQETYGPNEGTAKNIAICREMLGEVVTARP
jgi:hypothetical protein